MYRLLVIAKYDRALRYSDSDVVCCGAAGGDSFCLGPTKLRFSLSFDCGPGMYEFGPFGEDSSAPVPVTMETFHALQKVRLTKPERQLGTVRAVIPE